MTQFVAINGRDGVGHWVNPALVSLIEKRPDGIRICYAGGYLDLNGTDTDLADVAAALNNGLNA